MIRSDKRLKVIGTFFHFRCIVHLSKEKERKRERERERERERGWWEREKEKRRQLYTRVCIYVGGCGCKTAQLYGPTIDS